MWARGVGGKIFEGFDCSGRRLIEWLMFCDWRRNRGKGKSGIQWAFSDSGSLRARQIADEAVKLVASKIPMIGSDSVERWVASATKMRLPCIIISPSTANAWRILIGHGRFSVDASHTEVGWPPIIWGCWRVGDVWAAWRGGGLHFLSVWLPPGSTLLKSKEYQNSFDFNSYYSVESYKTQYKHNILII